MPGDTSIIPTAIQIVVIGLVAHSAALTDYLNAMSFNVFKILKKLICSWNQLAVIIKNTANNGSDNESTITL